MSTPLAGTPSHDGAPACKGRGAKPVPPQAVAGPARACGRRSASAAPQAAGRGASEAGPGPQGRGGEAPERPLLLLADCGNSALKLGWSDGDRLLGCERMPDDPGAWSALRRRLGADRLVLLPGNRQRAGRVGRWWADEGCTPLRELGRDIPAPAVGQYPGFGADRLAAGLAAWHRVGGDVIVVDGGTATTLTAWRSSAQGPTLAGGLILPGATACLAGLAAAAPALPLTDVAPPDADPLQLDTRGALGAAMGIGYPAMVRACLDRMRGRLGGVQVIVTGGCPAVGLPTSDSFTSVAGLVLEGMLIWNRFGVSGSP